MHLIFADWWQIPGLCLLTGAALHLFTSLCWSIVSIVVPTQRCSKSCWVTHHAMPVTSGEEQSWLPHKYLHVPSSEHTLSTPLRRGGGSLFSRSNRGWESLVICPQLPRNKPQAWFFPQLGPIVLWPTRMQEKCQLETAWTYRGVSWRSIT